MNLGSAFPGQFLDIEKVKNEFCGVSIGLEKRVLILSVFLESENLGHTDVLLKNSRNEESNFGNLFTDSMVYRVSNV